MRILGRQFVMGRTIDEALERARSARSSAAIATPTTCWARRRAPTADAERYFRAYRAAIAAIGRGRGGRGIRIERPGISVKLSALHPRYEFAQRAARDGASWCRALADARQAAPSAPASASPSTPRRPTGSTCRST